MRTGSVKYWNQTTVWPLVMCFRYSHRVPRAERFARLLQTQPMLTSGDRMMQGSFLSLHFLQHLPVTQSSSKSLKPSQLHWASQHLTSFQVLTVFQAAPGSFYLCYGALGPKYRDQLKKCDSCPQSLGSIPLDGPALSTPCTCLEGSLGDCHFTQGANSWENYHLRHLTFSCGRN